MTSFSASHLNGMVETDDVRPLEIAVQERAERYTRQGPRGAIWPDNAMIGNMMHWRDGLDIDRAAHPGLASSLRPEQVPLHVDVCDHGWD